MGFEPGLVRWPPRRPAQEQ